MDVYNVMYNFINALLPIGICVILPIIVVWLIIRERINRDNMRKDIILAAMEKNTDIDVEEMMKKLNGPKKLLKEMLLNRMLVGSLFCIFGVLTYIALAILLSINGFESITFTFFSCVAVPSIAIGLALLLNYYVGKKMLAKEMDAEEQNLRQS